jgi:hypothetical protein
MFSFAGKIYETKILDNCALYFLDQLQQFIKKLECFSILYSGNIAFQFSFTWTTAKKYHKVNEI